MPRWVALAPLLLVAGCLARVERAVIPARDPKTALEKSGAVLEREGLRLVTRDDRRIRTGWRFTERTEGDAFLYYRYVLEQDPPEADAVVLRVEVIRCLYAPRETEDGSHSGCATAAPRVPLGARSEYRRIEAVLRRRLSPPPR